MDDYDLHAQAIRIHDALDALPNPVVEEHEEPQRLSLLTRAAFKGSVEFCEKSWDLLPYVPSSAFEYAALGGSIACVQFLLSKRPKLSKNEKSNMLYAALEGCNPIEMIGHLLRDAKFSLYDYNPMLYRPRDTLPLDWAWDLQRRLAARELGHQAAKRALRYAGMHKDLIPLICEMIVKSKVEKW